MVVCYSLDVEGLLSEFIYDEELMTKSRGVGFNLRGRLDQKGDRSAQNSGIRNETFNNLGRRVSAAEQAEA